MTKKLMSTISACLVISGCSVNPELVTQDDVANTVSADTQTLINEQAVINGPVSLDDAIAIALQNNRERKLRAMESALALGQVSIAKWSMLPELTASAGYSHRSNYAASASVSFEDGSPESLSSDPSYSVSQERSHETESIAFSWNILDFGLSYVRAKQESNRYLISLERERKVAHNITQDVRFAYWRAVSSSRLLQKIEPLIQKATDALNASKQAETAQVTTPIKALYEQRELLDVLRSLQNLRESLVDAKVKLSSLMGLKPGTEFELVDSTAPDFTVPTLQINLEDMENIALQNRPELIETYYQERISASETRAAFLQLLPGISVNAGYYHDSNEYLLNNDWTSVGTQVSWNLLDVFSLGAKKDIAKTKEELAKQRRLASSLAVLTQVDLANVTYKQAVYTYTLADNYMNVSQRILNQANNQNKAGNTSQLDLIRESLNSVLAELRRDVAYANVQNSYGRIFVSMGMDLVPENYLAKDTDTLSSEITQRFSDWSDGNYLQSVHYIPQYLRPVTTPAEETVKDDAAEAVATEDVVVAEEEKAI